MRGCSPSSCFDRGKTKSTSSLKHKSEVWQKRLFSFLPLIFHPPLAPYIIQRKFLKIQRKISKVSILKFWAVKLFGKLFNGIGLHSWGPDASFDTHIAIYHMIHVGWHRRQIWHFWHFCQKWRIWYPTFAMSRYGNMGVKWRVRTSGMQTNAIKQLSNKFNGSKFQNTIPSIVFLFSLEESLFPLTLSSII